MITFLPQQALSSLGRYEYTIPTYTYLSGHWKYLIIPTLEMLKRMEWFNVIIYDLFVLNRLTLSCVV